MAQAGHRPVSWLVSWLVSWDEFHRDCRALTRRLQPSGPFTALVAVTRGGLVPAGIVARELDIRVVETMAIASYGDENQRGAVRVIKDVDPAYAVGGGVGVLVVDDLVDSGETARVVRKRLPKAHFATVYAKPASRSLVDTFAREVTQDTWIYFPWDLGLAVQAPLADEGRRSDGRDGGAAV